MRTTANATKCYQCLFYLGHCTTPLDCYNQPDVCSNANFSPVHSQVADCEFGCEQYLVTDATGSIISWRRGCATPDAPRSSYICYSRIFQYLRHEQCWCHSDYCNSSSRFVDNHSSLLLAVSLLISLPLVMRQIHL